MLVLGKLTSPMITNATGAHSRGIELNLRLAFRGVKHKSLDDPPEIGLLQRSEPGAVS